jgi:hypothetical protein
MLWLCLYLIYLSCMNDDVSFVFVACSVFCICCLCYLLVELCWQASAETLRRHEALQRSNYGH